MVKIRDSFVQIPPDVLRSFSNDNIKTPSLYYHPFYFLREGFWLRLRFIFKHLVQIKGNKGKCLDFGGGSGVLLPTLAKIFDEVVCIDQDPTAAYKIIEYYKLAHKVKIIQTNVLKYDFKGELFDVVIAADVLEHFEDLVPPVQCIKKILKKDGYFVTSLPSENWIYVLARKIFSVTKPVDHYHSAYEVEKFIGNSEFKLEKRKYLPFFALKLFHISRWKIK